MEIIQPSPQYPKVSVIIPCYNAADYITHAIQSVFCQTYPNLEIIVVDDGSTDNSLEIIRSFGEKVRWVTGPNRGGCSARNQGIDLATGDYIQFLDADDLFFSERKIEAQVSALRNEGENTIATGPWHYISSQGEIQNRNNIHNSHIKERGIDLLIYLWTTNQHFLPHCWLCSSKLIRQVGKWDESLTADQDGEFFGRILLQSTCVHYIEEASVLYRKTGDKSVSKQRTKTSLESRLRASQTISDLLWKKQPCHQTAIAIRNRWYFIALNIFAEHNLSLAMKAVKNGQAKDGGKSNVKIGGTCFRILNHTIGFKPAIFLKWAIKFILRKSKQKLSKKLVNSPTK